MTDPNAYAFPMLDNNGNYVQYGATIREHFASLAMQGYMAHPCTGHQDATSVAEYAVNCADALIEALNKNT